MDVATNVMEEPSKTTPRDLSRVLLVDDEPSLTSLFKMVLSMEIPDIEIDTAGNGLEALESFSINHHGVLVMDLHMPIMDGFAAFIEIQRMCNTRKWEMPAVIFCTGYAPPDALKKIFVDSQDHCVISKPISPFVITEAVNKRLTSSCAS